MSVADSSQKKRNACGKHIKWCLYVHTDTDAKITQETHKYGVIAQKEAHLIWDQEAVGSNPTYSTITPPEVYPAKSITADGRLINHDTGGF